MKWEPNAVKAQLRLTAQRLGQLQAKNDSQANITRTDIATLLRGGNVALAREKAEKLLQDEAFGDMLEMVEMHTGALLEHFHEIEFGLPPGPVVVEAASTVIYTAPYIQSKDLDIVRNFLAQYLGPDFTRSAVSNREHYVSKRVLKALSLPIPSAYRLDFLLYDIAKTYGVPWSPEPPRQSIVNSLSEFLDPEASPEVDLLLLRRLCLRGIPDEPAWLRPRIWKLLLGILPKSKASWKTDSSKLRESYYDLVKRLLEPFSHSSPDSSRLDDKLLSVFKQLSTLPRDIYALLEEEPESFSICPLAEDAPEDIRISCAEALERRLKQLQSQDRDGGSSPMPEIRLEPEADETPGISLTTFDSGIPESSATSTTLLPSRKSMFGNVHEKHCSTLLRILYLHNSINPGNLSPYTASLLVPVYSAMIQEVEVEDLAHVEADTFWVLEAVVAEFSALDDDGGKLWMKKETWGLDPALPHYSYRWLSPVLSHTLPVSSLLVVWDALFSRPPQERATNAKLEYLVDVCASMLIRAKNPLHRLNTAGPGSRSLWTGEPDFVSQSDHSEDAFAAALTFLRVYDLKHVGGMDRVLQTAAELAQRREQEAVAAQQPALSLGARFNLWRGYAVPQGPESGRAEFNKPLPLEPKESNGTEIPASSYPNTLASQITNTVWRGITNQSAMDVPSEPSSPLPPSDPLPSSDTPSYSSSASQATTNIWGYAEKLKGSDAVATISKVGSNWRARGILGSWGATSPAPSNAPVPPVAIEHGANGMKSPPLSESPRLFSPPPSRSPRPEEVPHQAAELLSPQSTAGLVEKTKSLFTVRSPPATVSTPKSAPKPLLLNSTKPIISGQRNSTGHPCSSSLVSDPDTDEWADVMRLKKQHFHRDSQSSVSSLSPSDAYGRVPKSSKSDWESDTNSSRVVSLNRRSISPMAPSFRVAHARASSRASSASPEVHSPPTLAKSPLAESSLVGGLPVLPRLDIQTEQSSSPEALAPNAAARAPESSDSETTSNEQAGPTRKPSWKTTTTAPESTDATRTAAPSRSARVRSKRHPRPANLQIQDSPRSRTATEQKDSSPSTLTVEWPAEDQENIMTPKASSFDSDDQPSLAHGMVRTPRRTRKVSAGSEKSRKGSTDGVTEERPRKLSSTHRTRKISTESREIPKNRRESAAADGDDEGYDELLSAYESEDMSKGTTTR